jgi:phenylacetate-coenzyme A ligase PaaK-like adenylate-forming protein
MILEVLRDDGRPALPGEEGEVVGTALHSWIAPLIRFRMGDLVTRGAGPCSCGASNSVLTRVQGRVADRFFLPSGRSIHPRRRSRVFGYSWFPCVGQTRPPNRLVRWAVCLRPSSQNRFASK